jgi:hypothetical protein
MNLADLFYGVASAVQDALNGEMFRLMCGKFTTAGSIYDG